MEIMDAVESDIAAIAEIYNDAVSTSTAIFNDVPVSLEDRLRGGKTACLRDIRFLEPERKRASQGSRPSAIFVNGRVIVLLLRVRFTSLRQRAVTGWGRRSWKPWLHELA